jgi:hypothetical protein
VEPIVSVDQPEFDVIPFIARYSASLVSQYKAVTVGLPLIVPTVV